MGTAYNSPSAGDVAATSTTSAAAPAIASASPPDCNSQAISRRDNGGLCQLEVVITDMGNLQSAVTASDTDLSARADASKDEASLQTAVASLQALPGPLVDVSEQLHRHWVCFVTSGGVGTWTGFMRPPRGSPARRARRSSASGP